MTATLTAPQTMESRTGGGERILHAFPPGSSVALCGRLLRDEQTASRVASRHCAECVHAASRSNPTSR